MPAMVGTYEGGHKFCVIGASGTRITSTVPASQQIGPETYPADAYDGEVTETTWRHGMQQIATLSGLYNGNGEGPASQPFDGRTKSYGGGGPLPYTHGDNKNPGATGASLTITTPCTIIQALSRDDADLLSEGERRHLLRRDVLHFVSAAPATDALPPPIGAAAGGSLFTKADISLSAFPTHAPVTGGGAPESTLNLLRWTSNFEFSARPRGDYYAGANYEPFYASEQAALYAGAALALCSNIDSTTRSRIATQVVIHAQNVVAALNAGARYNYNSGLGGILAGRKLFVVLAYIMTGDAYFGDWAVRTDWAAEDMQVRYVSAQDVIDYDYIAADEGMPDWNENWERTLPLKRTTPKSTYQNIFTMHNISQALACMMVTGAKAAWNNNAFFDYADRIMERTLYDGSGTNQWARTLSGTNSPSTYTKAFWDAHRSDGGMPAIWNW